MMIPDSQQINKKFIRIMIIPLFVLCVLLTSSLLRNSWHISLAEMLVGLGAIGLTTSIALMRNGRGYWAYNMLTLRIYEDPQHLATYQGKISLTGLSAYFYQPMKAGLSMLLQIVLISGLVWLCCPSAWRTWGIVLAGGIILPCLLLRQLYYSSIFWFAYSIAAHANQLPWQVKPRTLTNYLGTDIVLMLIVNLAVVLPIRYKPEFSLAQGYANPAFVVAFLILMVIVQFFLFFVALPSRRYSILGELLLGQLQIRFPRIHPLVAITTLPAAWRLVVWLLVVALWSVLICLLFATLQLPVYFSFLYLVALLPLMGIFYTERYRVLQDDCLQAQEMMSRIDYFKNR